MTTTDGTTTWTGRWVADRLDVRLATTSSPVGLELPDLVGLALRRNPRRAHRLVSRVLGKHVPTDPRVVHGSGLLLGLLVREVLSGSASRYHVDLGTLLRAALGSGDGADAEAFRSAVGAALGAAPVPAPAPLVLGYAETAVALGHSVARALPGAGYLHSTRREVTGFSPVGGFEEEHSHATSHLLLPADPALLDGDGAAARPLVLVDDELSTGTTVRNTLTALHRLAPRERYVVAALVDLRSAEDEERLAAHAAALGARVDVVALVRGRVDLPPDVLVRYSTTTRSPALPVDDAGYALRDALLFAGPEDGEPRFAYNLPCAEGADVVVVTDDPAAGDGLRADGGLLDVLTSHPRTRRTLVTSLPTVVPTLPPTLHGPAFGSYRADEVSWLLTDLSHVELEAPTAEREREIQSGRAHYAESLPIEFQPDPAYYDLFHASVRDSAARIAHAVGVVSELLLAERGAEHPERLVLASLARAGTPVGVLMRRWFQRFHGLDVPHHAVSIVRGRGIDALALRYLAEHHDPASVVFVDGWTGKGAIARELTAALDLHAERTGVRFDDALAVLADPGECVTTYGTRDDFLIPSACLNSTVSGLVSRTVLNDDLIGPGDFHGAKFYAELAGADVSNEYLDAVTTRFDEVRDHVAADWRAVAASDRTPTWAGWAAVERISEEYGIGQVNLVKPGVGETTRVLLRRVPERVLVRPGAAADLPHVLALAQARGVPVEEVAGLAYSCVGLIDPTAGGEG